MARGIIALLVLSAVGCSPKGPGTTEPEDPCERAANPSLWDSTFDNVAYQEQCKAQKVAQAQAQIEAQLAADRERRQKQEQEWARLAARQAEEEAAAAEQRAIEQAQERRAREEQAAYVAALEDQQCEDWDVVQRHYQVLAEYQSSEERDRAIVRLEGCRKQLLLKMRSRGKSVVGDARREFAISLEDEFDAQNPYLRGNLVAKVKGSELHVRMKGNFEGRARHSQEEVEAWCGATSVFSKIILKNSHGVFSCKPTLWPGSTKKYVQSILDEIGVAEPFVTDPGTKPAPVFSTTDPFATAPGTRP